MQQFKLTEENVVEKYFLSIMRGKCIRKIFSVDFTNHWIYCTSVDISHANA